MQFMEARMRKLLAVTVGVLGSAAFSCSSRVEPEVRTSFMGHVIGESSMAWASEEGIGDSDPLSRCQEILRFLGSPSVEQSLESAQKCRDFVNRGTYLIDLREPTSLREKVFEFTNWRLSLFIIKFASDERDRVTAELDSRFVRIVRGKVWRGKDGATIEIRPPEQLSLVTGKASSDGFLVVISDASP